MTEYIMRKKTNPRKKYLSDNPEISDGDGKIEKQKRWWEVYGEKKKEDKFNYTEEDEQRMDIIGQNGNDGIHYEEEQKIKGSFSRKK